MKFVGSVIYHFTEMESSETGSLLQLKSDLVSTSTSKDRRTIARCTFFTCFDVYRCGQNEDDVMKVCVDNF